jgi:nucleoid-associated protein YgaU
MTSYTSRTVSRRRTGGVERDRPARRPMRPKLVAVLLAVGILLLGGGGVVAATRPTWRPAMIAVAKPGRRELAGTGAAATAGADNSTASAASAAHDAAVPSAPAVHTRIGSVHHASSSGGSAHAGKAAWRARSKPAVTYTVKSGDTLSGIAAWFKLHGYGRLYAANRSVIGSNPDLIHPGERITISHGVMSLRSAKRQPSSSS